MFGFYQVIPYLLVNNLNSYSCINWFNIAKCIKNMNTLKIVQIRALWAVYDNMCALCTLSKVCSYHVSQPWTMRTDGTCVNVLGAIRVVYGEWRGVAWRAVGFGGGGNTGLPTANNNYKYYKFCLQIHSIWSSLTVMHIKCVDSYVKSNISCLSEIVYSFLMSGGRSWMAGWLADVDGCTVRAILHYTACWRFAIIVMCSVDTLYL